MRFLKKMNKFNSLGYQEELRIKKNAKENESVCQYCEKIYEDGTEPTVIRESGEFMCEDCWIKD